MTIHEKLAHKIYAASTAMLIGSKLQKFREKAGKRQNALYGLNRMVSVDEVSQ